MEVQKLRIEQVCPSPMNPRKSIDEDAINELAENISKQGLLQPITVRPIEYEDVLDDGVVVSMPTKYEIICGERRYRAVKSLHEKDSSYDTILSIVREMNDDEAFDAMITENLQRKDVNPLEEAFAFAQLAEKGHSTSELAVRFGKSNRFILDRIKLNKLIPELKEWVKTDKLPMHGAIMLSKLSEENQEQFVKQYKDFTISISVIKRFIEGLFMLLDNTAWYSDDSLNNYPKCKGCEFNTCNQGCLFYEMNSKVARCTNRDCFDNKKIAYIIKKIKETPNVIKKGESLEWSKVAIVANKNEHFSDRYMTAYNTLLQNVKEAGYEVFSEDVFGCRSWRRIEDESGIQAVQNHMAYKCITLSDYSGINFEECLYNVKEYSSSNTPYDPVTSEANELMNKKRAALLKKDENIASDIRLYAGKVNYGTLPGTLSETESLSFYELILDGCPFAYKTTLGISDYDAKKMKKYVEQHIADKEKWCREWMRNMFCNSSMTYNKRLVSCALDVLKEKYKDDVTAITNKYENALHRKLDKIEKRLGELGYNINGEKV